MQRVFQVMALTAACAVFAAGSALGETITGTLSSGGTSSSAPIDISSNTTDWAYYGIAGQSGNVFSADVKSGGPVSFSSASATQSADVGANSWGYGSDSRTYVSFSGGSSDSSATASQKYIYASGSITITHTLLASSETLAFYLVDCCKSINLSATLKNSGVSYSVTNTQLGYTDDNSHYSGILTLTVSGTVGETLTFTISSNTRTATWNSVALEAASVTTAPEPASVTLLISGVVGLLAYAWRKRRR